MPADRLVDANDLVLLRDISERTGLHPTAVANIASGHRRRLEPFPRPVAGRGQRGIWLWSEVEAWWKSVKPETVEGVRAASKAAKIRPTRPLPRAKRYHPPRAA